MIKRENLPAWRGCLAVFGGFLVQLTLGSTFTIGNMTPYFLSYLHDRGDESATSKMVVWVRACSMVGQGIAVYPGGLIEKRFGTRIGCIIGSLAISGGVILTYFTLKATIIAVAITYGLLIGIGFGLALYPAMICAIRWFPARKGFVTGIIMAGFGAGGFVFDQVQTEYINPDNIKANTHGYFTDKEVLRRIPLCMFLSSGIFLALQIIGCILLQDPPQGYKSQNQELQTTADNDSVAKEKGDLSMEFKAAPVEPPNKKLRDLTALEAMKTRVFYIMWFTVFLNTATVTYIGSAYKQFGLTEISDDRWLARIGSIGSAFNCMGKFIWGYISDRAGYKVSLSILCGTMVILAFTMQLTVKVSVLYGFSVWFFNCQFAGCYVTEPIYCHAAFGSKHAGPIYGLVMFGRATMGIGIALLSQYVYPLDNVGYHGMFYIIGSMSGAAFLLTFLYKLPNREEVDDTKLAEVIS